MRTLHIVPGDCASDDPIQAFSDGNRSDEVIPFRENLSCGPIDSYEARAGWWAGHFPGEDVGTNLELVMDRLASAQEQLVIWFGRHASGDYSLFLAMVELLAERPYKVVDVNSSTFEFERRDGARAVNPPAQAVGLAGVAVLRKLLGTERALTADETTAARQNWQRLRAENAPFRILTESRMISAPVDYFDSMILDQIPAAGRTAALVIGFTMGLNNDPYMQVGDAMLLLRIEALKKKAR